MDLEDIRCPTCGGRVRVMFDTIMSRGMRMPTDAFLACALGHRASMGERSAGAPAGESAREPGLIG
jgi:hypothetical protein